MSTSLCSLPLEILIHIIDIIVPIFSLNKKYKNQISVDKLDTKIIYKLGVLAFPAVNIFHLALEKKLDKNRVRVMRDVINLYKTCSTFYKILSNKKMKRFWKMVYIFETSTRGELSFNLKIEQKLEELNKKSLKEIYEADFEQCNWYIALYEDEQYEKERLELELEKFRLKLLHCINGVSVSTCMQWLEFEGSKRGWRRAKYGSKLLKVLFETCNISSDPENISMNNTVTMLNACLQFFLSYHQFPIAYLEMENKLTVLGYLISIRLPIVLFNTVLSIMEKHMQQMGDEADNWMDWVVGPKQQSQNQCKDCLLLALETKQLEHTYALLVSIKKMQQLSTKQHSNERVYGFHSYFVRFFDAYFEKSRNEQISLQILNHLFELFNPIPYDICCDLIQRYKYLEVNNTKFRNLQYVLDRFAPMFEASLKHVKQEDSKGYSSILWIGSSSFWVCQYLLKRSPCVTMMRQAFDQYDPNKMESTSVMLNYMLSWPSQQYILKTSLKEYISFAKPFISSPHQRHILAWIIKRKENKALQEMTELLS